MKHIKSVILILLTALFTLPASTQAQDSNSTRILYEQNFESVSNVEEAGWICTRNLGTIEADDIGNYIEFSLGSNNGRSANLTWGKEIFFENGDSEKSLLIDGKYQVKYDFCIKKGSSNQYNSSMTVFTNHTPESNQPYRNPWSPEGYWQNYLFDMSQVNGESLQYVIDGGTIRTVIEDGTISYSIDYRDPSTFEEGAWYTVSLDVNVNDRTVDYSITSLTGELFKQGQMLVPQNDVNGEPISIYAEGLHLMLARYGTIYDLDNIVVSCKMQQASLAAGDDFEYEGIWYTLIDPEVKTCKTKDGYYDDGSWIPGNNCEGDVTIPATVSDGNNDYTVVSIGEHAFYECTDLTSIYIPEGVTSFGRGAFWGCLGLKLINIPTGVTSIGNFAFYNCSGLTSINIPEGVTSIEMGAFFSCSGLKSIIIPEGVTAIEESTFNQCSSLTSIKIPESVRSIGSVAFRSCSSLTSINIPEGVTSIGFGAFRGCSSLTSINIPEGVTSIESYTFGGCSGFTSINIPEGVTSIGEGAFETCYSLTKINLPASLTSIEERAFADCNSKVTFTYMAVYPIAVPDICNEELYSTATLNTPNATLATVQATTPWNKFKHIIAKDGSIGISLASGDDFEYEGIWYTVLDANAKTCKTKDGYYDSETMEHFSANNCRGDLTIPSIASDGTNNYDVVEIGNYAFSNCSELTSVILPESVTSIGMGAFADCSNLTSVNIPAGVTSISNSTFYLCSKLASIDIPEGVTSIGWLAFHWCESLTSIHIPDAVTSIGSRAFCGCTNLLSINIPEGVTIIEDGLFQYCNSLMSIDIPIGVTSIGELAFQECFNITAINIPSGVTSIGSKAFYYCRNLNEVHYYASSPIEAPEDVFLYSSANGGIYDNASLNTPNATLADIQATVPWNMFKHIIAKDGSVGSSLSAGDDFEYEGIWYTVIDPDAKTCRIKEGDWNNDNPYAGNNVSGDLVIPSVASDGVNDYTVVSIGNYAFYGCLELTSITIPEGVTSIGSSAFELCTGLTSINIPKGVTSIEDYTFFSCSGLTSINIPEGVTSIGEGAFGCCSGLTSINIPEGVTSIGDAAFLNYYSNAEITYLASDPITASKDAFEGLYETSILKMPNATLASIQATVPWRIFHHIMAKDGSVGFVEAGEDFEYEGIWYTVVSAGKPLIGKADGSEMCDNLLSAIDNHNTFPCQIVSDSERGNVFMCEILPDRENPWDCEFYLKSNEPLQAGDLFTVSFMYKCSDQRHIDTYAHGEPGSYHHWKCVGTLNATTEWQRFYYSGIVAPEWVGDEGFISIDFLLSSAPEAATFYVDDVVFELGRSACKTKDEGNAYSGNLVIPDQVSSESNEYIVVAIGEQGFAGSSDLASISVPSTIESIGNNAFSGCERLTSLEWRGKQQMPEGVVEAISNPNLLVYVEDTQYAPEILDHNVVADGICEHLVLTPDYPFTPVNDFTAKSSSFTKEFLQTTPVDGCAGWETIVLPFDVTRVVGPDGKAVTAFDAVTDVSRQRPYWLYEADPTGEWKSASAINAGVPYIISMPNNPRYNPAYNIHGAVTFSNPNPQLITTGTTAPYVTTWASGRKFRSLWLPLDDSEKATAMGLNVGIDNLTDDDGVLLAPGSAFHSGVLPKPLEAYVVSNGNTKAFRIWGSQSAVLMLPDEDGLKISQDGGILTLQSSGDRVVEIFSADGTLLRRIELKADFPVYIEGLPQGVCLIAGRKVIIR